MQPKTDFSDKLECFLLGKGLEWRQIKRVEGRCRWHGYDWRGHRRMCRLFWNGTYFLGRGHSRGLGRHAGCCRGRYLGRWRWRLTYFLGRGHSGGLGRHAGCCRGRYLGRWRWRLAYFLGCGHSGGLGRHGGCCRGRYLGRWCWRLAYFLGCGHSGGLEPHAGRWRWSLVYFLRWREGRRRSCRGWFEWRGYWLSG